MTDEQGRYGVLDRLRDGHSRLRFTRVLRHSPDKVWRAVSESQHLAAWFPSTIDGERKAGAPLRFTFPAGEAEPMDGEMLSYMPPSLMEIRWGTDVVRIEVRPHPLGTELTLLDTLDEHGKAARDAAGWHACLDALDRHLDGDAEARSAMGGWREFHTHYVEDLGPEAATIGPPEGV